jgi:hypothetical protein
LLPDVAHCIRKKQNKPYDKGSMFLWQKAKQTYDEDSMFLWQKAKQTVR